MVGDGRAHERAAAAFAAAAAELSYEPPTCIEPEEYDPGAKCGEKIAAALAALAADSCWAAAAAATTAACCCCCCWAAAAAAAAARAVSWNAYAEDVAWASIRLEVSW